MLTSQAGSVGKVAPLHYKSVRTVSTKTDDVMLADALNLLSPNEYKPSLISNLTKGPVVEQYKNKDILNLALKRNTNHDKYIQNLLHGLNTTSKFTADDILTLSNKSLCQYLKGIKSQRKLLEVFDLLYHHQKLNIRLITEIVLNAALVDLRLINLEKLHLTLQNQVQLEIILLKKYHDLNKPMQIIRNLKSNFNDSYYPLIKRKKLPSFYERIVWKFNFQYILQYDQIYYINHLDNLSSSFLIWESSPPNMHKQIVETIQKKHQLNRIQSLFLSALTNESIVSLINQQVTTHGSSELLSSLKKLSIKFKVYQLDDTINDDNTRLVYYLLINQLENVIFNQLLQNGNENIRLIQLLNDVKCYRQDHLIKMEGLDPSIKWVDEQILNA
jgi:hypothetical protein